VNFPNLGFPTIYGSKTETTDGFIAAFEFTSIPKWIRWLNGEGTDVAYNVYTRPTNTAVVYICGSAGSSTTKLGSDLTSMGNKPSGSGTIGFLIKLDSDGSFNWGKWLDASGNDSCEDIIVDSFSNVYVAGYATGLGTTNTTTMFGSTKPSNLEDSFLVKYDLDGVLQWGKWFGGVGNTKYVDITLDKDNNIYATGYSTINNLKSINIDKYSTNGDILNSVAIGSELPYNYYSNGIVVDNDGYIYICGNSESGDNIGVNPSNMIQSPNTGFKGFLLKLNPDFTSVKGIWLGDTGAPTTGRFLSIDNVGALILLGNTTGSLTPFNDTSIMSVIGDKTDTTQGGYILKFTQELA
jgi:hypothetical protein